MASNISKVVIPVAGMGTRFLPATKAIPKELLPIVDRPLIQYALDEARAAGIEEFVFVTGPRENLLREYLSPAGALTDQLRAAGKTAELELLASILPPEGACSYVRQPEPLGIGHAVWCARDIVGEEPFAVMFPDDLILADRPTLRSMVEAFDDVGGNIVAAEDVPQQEVFRYGVIDPGERVGDLLEVRGLIEKPALEDAPSTKCIIGRYILVPEIFEPLASIEKGAGGEIQLTDAIAALIGRTPTHAFPIEGVRYDCGSKAGFVAATLAIAKAHSEIGVEVRKLLSDKS